MFTIGQQVSEIAETGKLYPGIITDLRENRINQVYIKFDDGETAWVDINNITAKRPTQVQQTIDGISFSLQENFDFSFISQYGKVFRIFDDLISGAICFGVEKEGKRYFLKFAGAKTVAATGQYLEDIVTALKLTVPKYRDLKHPLLINQIDAKEIGGGYLAIYDWFDGEGCGWMHPDAQKRFLDIPNKDKLRVYNGILEFHAHVIDCGYIAIDFNNGTILYNFDTNNFAFCDIDFYAKHSQITGWSGIWGDPFLKSPEECRGYSVVTEVSNVYTMGATAFYLFADKDKDSPEKWTLSEELYKVAKKAIEDMRCDRQQTIKEFISEWIAAGDFF